MTMTVGYAHERLFMSFPLKQTQNIKKKLLSIFYIYGVFLRLLCFSHPLQYILIGLLACYILRQCVKYHVACACHTLQSGTEQVVHSLAVFQQTGEKENSAVKDQHFTIRTITYWGESFDLLVALQESQEYWTDRVFGCSCQAV